MKPTKIRLMLLLLMIPIVLFVSCKEYAGTLNTDTDDTTAKGTETVPFVPYTLQYTVTDLTASLPLTASTFSGNEYDTLNSYVTYVENDILYIYSEKDDTNTDNPRLIAISPDGSTEIIPVPCPEGIVPVMARWIREDLFAVVCREFIYDREVDDFFRMEKIIVVRSSGDILASLEPQSDFPSEVDFDHEFKCRIDIDGDDVLFLVGVESYFLCYRYHTDTHAFSQSARIKTENPYIFQMSDVKHIGNGQYINQGYVGELLLLDTVQGTMQPYRLHTTDDMQRMSLLIGEDGAYYLNDDRGIYQYRDNALPPRLLQYTDCGMFLSSLSAFYPHVLDSDRFFVIITREENQKKHSELYYISTVYAPTEEDGRQVIRLDYYGNLPYNQRLNEAVAAFNRENTEYRVDIREITQNGMKPTEQEEDFRDRVLYAPHPDMILMETVPFSLDKYYEKNTFLDLADSIGGQLLGCVREAVSWDGAIYTVPMDMTLSTFVCTAETEDAFLTWESFFSVMNTLGENEVLTSDPAVEDIIRANGVMDFFDPATGVAQYDSELFRSMILYTDSIAGVTDETVGYLCVDLFNTMGYTNLTLPQRVTDGGIKFLNVMLNSPNRLLELSLFFGENAWNICGYPSQEGGGAALTFYHHIGVFSDTKNRDGCIRFIEFLLSEERTGTSPYQALPVTESGMRNAIDKCRYAYYISYELESIGSLAAILHDTTDASLQELQMVPLSPIFSTEIPIDPENYFKTYDGTVSVGANPLTGELEETTYKEVILNDVDVEKFMYFLNNCHMKAGSDTTVLSIVEEELSYWESGIGTLEDASKKIQSRVQIYLSE